MHSAVFAVACGISIRLGLQRRDRWGLHVDALCDYVPDYKPAVNVISQLSRGSVLK